MFPGKSKHNITFLLSSHLAFVIGLILFSFHLFIPCHMIVAGYCGFALDIHVSVCPSVCFWFLGDNLSRPQWIFTKVGMCIDIVEIWFGIVNRQILSNLTELSAHDMIMAGYYILTFLLNKVSHFSFFYVFFVSKGSFIDFPFLINHEGYFKVVNAKIGRNIMHLMSINGCLLLAKK